MIRPLRRLRGLMTTGRVRGPRARPEPSRSATEEKQDAERRIDEARRRLKQTIPPPEDPPAPGIS